MSSATAHDWRLASISRVTSTSPRVTSRCDKPQATPTPPGSIPTQNYGPTHMNPRRVLTKPSKPANNEGYDNAKGEPMTPPITPPYPPNTLSPSYDNNSPQARGTSVSTPNTPFPYPQHSSSPYYGSGQDMQVDAPRGRRGSGFKRVRDARDLRPVVNAQPQGRRMGADGAYLSTLRQLTTNIIDTYRICNPAFRYESTHNPRRVLTKPSKPVHNEGYDNDDYDYILYVNDWLGTEEGHEYLIIDILGQGTFGQVVECQDVKTHEIVAVKVVKNKPAYFNQSMMEVTILELLNTQYDPQDEHHILRLRDSFIHRSHLCLVFELLSSNLYELLKQNQFQGLGTQLVKLFTAQLLDAMTVLKEAQLIHCDLKLENILLKSLQSPQIKLIDFGSACHERQTVYTYIQSRFYRSPEVLLGIPYTASIDMWSLGCIAVELFLGLPLFPGTSEYNQITRIVETVGCVPFYGYLLDIVDTDLAACFRMPPTHMLDMGKQTHQFFDSYIDHYGQKKYRLKTLEQYSREHNTNEQPGKQYFKATSLPEIVYAAPMPTFRSSSSQGHEMEKELNNRASFIDFCAGLLNLDPIQRWSPQQARQHPFITGEKFVRPFTGRRMPTAQPIRLSRLSSSKFPITSLYAADELTHSPSPASQMPNPFTQQYASHTSGGGSNSLTIAPNMVPAPPSNTYYNNSRHRANTINQMDTVPPALARLQHMNQDVIAGRNALTPVLNRDDAMREWERRQTGKPPAAQPYPQLEYLQQQAELAGSGLTNWAQQLSATTSQRLHPPPPLDPSISTRVFANDTSGPSILEAITKGHIRAPAMNTKDTFEAILALDVVALTAQMTILLMDNAAYKRLLECRGDSAQALLNLLQARLDYPIEPAFKRRHLQALIKLSERARKYPECLLLQDITLPQYAAAGGSFGDVYKSSLAGYDVAVKVIKMYKKSNMDEILKALDVAQGLEYLHTEHVVHADLKCANILVSHARRACLADFGLATPRESMSVLFTVVTAQPTGGTLNWTAPELLPDMTDSEADEHETRRPDPACDVYAFAMVCYEMFSGCIPFQGKRAAQVINAIGHGRRPDRPVDDLAHTRGLTDLVWGIITKCWQQQPEERFSAAQAVQQLCALPDRPVDTRPLDNYNIPPPSRMMYKQAQHPFSILEEIAL
ncbi:hypothetical protein HWV62_16024 [Athelia sp. TMB]|nr:hypothetical protein HWV62_16024 [Athelia sp. TMB]